MARSYEEILKELNEQTKNITYIPPEQRMNSFKRTDGKISLPKATRKYQNAQQNLKNQQNLMTQNITNRGIQVNRYGTEQLPSYNTIKSNALNDWNLKKDYNALQNVAPSNDRDNLNQQMYSNYQKTDEFKNQFENIQQAKDDLGYARYDYDVARVQNEDVNAWDRSIFSRGLRGITRDLTKTNSKVRDGKGNYITLPTYSDLKDAKIADSYGDDFLGKTHKFLGDAAFNTGRIATSAVLNSIAPGIGTVEYFGSMYQDSYNNAINEGYDDKKAISYATISTATEFVTEKLLGGTTKALTGGKASAVNQGIANGLSKIMNNKTIINALSHAGAEGIEEFVQEYVDKLNRNITLGEKNKVISLETFGDAIYSAAVGALTGVVGSVGDNSLNITTKQDLQQMQNRTNLNNINLPPIDQNQVNSSIPKVNNQNELINPNRYQYQQTDNVKINNLRQSASQYFDNSEQTSNMINTIEKVISDKNYNVEFDNAIKNKFGNSVNAQIATNENGEVDIKINPNSERAGEFLLMHEVTHAIETNSMKNLILDYAEKNADFNQSLESLKQAYGVNDVSSEVVADISGQLFGNQEFINSLSMEQPSVFKKIYNTIVSIANKITGNSRESLFLKDLQNKWETAYRTQYNNLKSTEYSKGKLINGEDVVISDDIIGTRPDKAKAEQLLKNMLGIQYVNKSSNKNISIENKDIKKFLNDGYNNYKNSKLKKRISGNYGEVIELAKIDPTLSKPNYKGTNRGKQGFDYYIVNIAYPIKDTTGNIIDYNYYESRLVVRKDNNNNFAYDLDNFKEKKGTALDKTSLSITTGNPVSNSFSTNNVSQSNTSVKLPTKYSMQENQNSSFSLPQDNSSWQEHLEKNYKSTGTRTNMKDIKIPTKNDLKKVEYSNINVPQIKKNMNPVEISNLTLEDANTTPNLPKINRNKVSDGESHYAKNIQDKTDMLTEEQKSTILADDEVKYYDKITNKESLEKAFKEINNDGKLATEKFFNKKSEDATAIDVAKGWILLKQYADRNNSDGMVEVAKKMRDMGTKAGQTVQAFNIMARMTPEGMVKYAQSELSEAYDKMVKNKSKDWIDENRSKFDLTPKETQAIMKIMKDVSKMEDGYDKRVKLAEIQKIMTDKLPPTKGAGIKAWMRISMLFNPKTQVRNVMGNAVIAPVNYFSDIFSGLADKAIANKTGYRTTGKTDTKSYVKGFKKGLFESYNDFKKGINTRNIEGNRFEIGEGKSFNDKTKIGKALNKTDQLLSFMLDAGDRGFYEASFTNSINNQLVLNNTTKVTQEMIDIATSEALSRTWQDNNAYTKFVLQTRNSLNKINIKGYGLGDVLIPFAKTPANLTKAIVDYSPAGLVNTMIKGKNLKNAIETGQFTPKMQHEFVQSLGKATAGSMLYILGFALAKAGITSGESDEDKDVRDFMRNTLGTNSYSIKIGNKSFSYDWAQPIAAPLSITANIVQKEKDKATLLNAITTSLDEGFNVVLQQSFFESINNVFSETGKVPEKIFEEVLSLPSRTIPTLMKQIVDLTDSTQRQTFEYDKPLKTAYNKVVSKIPGLSKTLIPSVDTMGREIQRYGGKNNLFNVFLNPANVNTENINESAKEIYRLYKETGESNILPRVSPYYINKKGEKIILSSEQRADYQKNSGKIIDANVNKLLKSDSYKKMSNKEKADVINDIVNYSYNIAQKETLNMELSKNYEKAYEYSKIGNISDYYTFKNSIDDTNKDTKKESITNYLLESSLSDKELSLLYSDYYSSENELNDMISMNIPIKDFIRLNSQEFESDYYSNGKAVTNSKRNKIINYVNGLKLSIPQKAILIKSQYPSYKTYDNQIVTYLNKQNISKYDKVVLLKKIGFDDFDKYIVSEVNSQNLSKAEKEKMLKDMGFRIINGRVYK